MGWIDPRFRYLLQPPISLGDDMNTPQKVREAKEAQPANFCVQKNCLWRIRGRNGELMPGCTDRYCPRHK